MANMPGIVIKVAAETANAVNGLNRVNKAMGRTAKGADKFRVGMKGLALGAAGAASAVAGMAVAVGVDAVKAFNEEEDALATFHQTLTNLGLKESADQLDRWIDNLQYSANVADSDLRPAMERLLRSTHDVGKAQESLTLALDISAAVHKPLADVANALGKAWDGNRVSLGRLGLGLDKATLKAGTMSDLIQQLTHDFGGQSETSANTLTGSMHGVSIAWDELQESLGKGLVGGTDGVEGAVQKMSDLEQALRDLQPTAEDTGGAISDFLAGTVTGLAAVTQAWKATDAGNWADAFTILHPDNRAEWEEARNRVNGVVASAADLTAEFDRTTAAAHRAARAITNVGDVAADPMGGSGVHDYYGRIQNDYVRGLQAKGARVRRRAAKKAARADAAAKARRDEISKRHAEAKTGSHFGGQRAHGQASC